MGGRGEEGEGRRTNEVGIGELVVGCHHVHPHPSSSCAGSEEAKQEDAADGNLPSFAHL